MSNVTVVDCTLRDGGYYCSWDFDATLVAKYLSCVVAAGVDVIEIGFRFISTERFCGPFAFTTDEFINSIDLPTGPKFAVMINTAEYLHQYPKPLEAINRLFLDRTQSIVSIVRLATHIHDIEGCIELTKILKDKGYYVVVNLMQATSIVEDGRQDVLDVVSTVDSVDVLYFADSLGNMKATEVTKLMTMAQTVLKLPIGFHAHDNMGRALFNTLTALDAGALWLDSTILGMGRGAGNAKTEEVLLELLDRGNDQYKPEELFSLVMTDFEELRKQYGWGSSLPYFLSGRYRIHPTYVQEMLSEKGTSADLILDALTSLKKKVNHIRFRKLNTMKFLAARTLTMRIALHIEEPGMHHSGWMGTMY